MEFQFHDLVHRYTVIYYKVNSNDWYWVGSFQSLFDAERVAKNTKTSFPDCEVYIQEINRKVVSQPQPIWVVNKI